jgi:GT2 family glycosyltransferase
MELSVIIVNWNAAAYLPAALAALFAAQDDFSMEVLLVDNASTDTSVSLVRARFPQVEVLENHENKGFAAANNQGLARARGRYILLLNPDTEMPATTLRTFVAYLEAHPQVGVVGPRLQARGGKIQGGAAGYDPSPSTIFNFSTFLYRLLPTRFKGLWLPRSLYKQSEPIPVDWVSGACMMVRREAYEAAGPLDERYFMYSEDVEWCRRIRQAGYRAVCLPNVRVTHHIGGSSRQLGPEFYAHNIDSLDLDLRSHYSTLSVAIMHLVGAFGFLLRYLLGELSYLRWQQPVYADIRDLWAACLKTSLLRTVKPAPGAYTGLRSPTSDL